MMMANYRFATTVMMTLQILLLFASLLPSGAKSLFRKSLLQSIPFIDNNNLTRNKRTVRPISTENLQNNSKSSVLNVATDVDEGSSQQQKRDMAHNEEEEEGLIFEGKFHYESDIVPISNAVMSSPATDLFAFFSDPYNRDLVIKGGGNLCESIALTPGLQDEWTSQSRIVKSTPPDGGNNDSQNRNEEILAVYSEVPIVPGLSLRAVSYTGCKTMKQPISALPYYEFTLLNESYQPVGKKAMTWIFDKVTGNNKNNNRGNNNKEKDNGRKKNKNNMETAAGKKKVQSKGTLLASSSEKTGGKKDDDDDTTVSSSNSNSNSRKTYALSRVTLEPFPQDGGCKICYYGHVKLTLSKRFLHMLPLPTGVVQAKVNKSIKRQLERECTKSIEKFTRALNKWNERDASATTATRT